MKALRYSIVIVSLIISMLMQACGGGGGASDTAGALTITAPTSTDNKDGSFQVTATVTYTPPAGKTAQGVVVTTTETDESSTVPFTENHTFTSGSNSVIYSFRVFQRVGISTGVSIRANIGDMPASVFIVIPPITPLSAPTIQFLSTDAAGTTHTSAITGGIQPYSILSVTAISGGAVDTDITATIAGTSLNVTNNTTGITPAIISITIGDASGGLATVQVGYFR